MREPDILVQGSELHSTWLNEYRLLVHLYHPLVTKPISSEYVELGVCIIQRTSSLPHIVCHVCEGGHHAHVIFCWDQRIDDSISRRIQYERSL